MSLKQFSSIIDQIRTTSMCWNSWSPNISLKDQLIYPSTPELFLMLILLYYIFFLVWKTIRQLFWLHPHPSPRQSNPLFDELFFTFLVNWRRMNPKCLLTLVVWLWRLLAANLHQETGRWFQTSGENLIR